MELLPGSYNRGEKCCTALNTSIQLWKGLGQLGVCSTETQQNRKKWVRKYITATGSKYFIYLLKKHNLETCIPLPILKWVSTTTAQSGFLSALCSKFGFLCCGDPHVQLSAPDPNCPRVHFPNSSPFWSHRDIPAPWMQAPNTSP